MTSGDLFPDKCAYGTQFTQTVAADYSLLWEVAYYDSYKVVKNGDAVHALHQCGVAAPTDLPAYAADATLVERARDGRRDDVVDVPSFHRDAWGAARAQVLPVELRLRLVALFAQDAPRRPHRGEGRLADPAQLPDLEALGVQATFASSWGMDEHNAVLLTDTAEQQPNAVLKTAEYVEYVGLYFNREKEAAAAIEHIVANWLCTKEAVAGVVQDKAPVKVLWAQYWGSATCGDGSSGGWSVASGNTWYSEIIEAAGGSLIVPAVEAACESWARLTCRQRSSSRSARTLTCSSRRARGRTRTCPP